MYREFELIERILEVFDQPEGIELGIGDDCAVLAPGRFDLVTTDTMVEGVHFRRDWSSAADIGWKALSVSLSDVAAMGGAPGPFFLNLSLGPDVDEAFIDALLAGMKAACDRCLEAGFSVSTAGGDVTATDGPTVVSTTLMGQSAPEGAILRSGASPGDRIVLLGPLGLAEAAVDLLAGRLFAGRVAADPAGYPALVEAHRRPLPRVSEGALLGREAIPSALIDTSDGFGQDLGHILERSAVGARVDVHCMPRHDELDALCEQLGADPLRYMISGGEDFQLCMTVPQTRMAGLRELARREQFEIFEVGEIRPAAEGLTMVGPDGAPLDVDTPGYEHFRADG
ncbi:MAG: thiamine-phosphate kinase [Persicimonas sp.]